jgi:hypothetical protein
LPPAVCANDLRRKSGCLCKWHGFGEVTGGDFDLVTSFRKSWG